MTNGSLMKVESIAECSLLEHSAILLTCIKLPFVIKTYFALLLSGRLRQVLLYRKSAFNVDLVVWNSFSSGIPSCQPLVKCKRAFQALINIAVEELCEVANSLIAPVRLGAARPTATFPLVSANVEAVQVGVMNF